MIDSSKLRRWIDTGDKERISHSLCDLADGIFFEKGAAAVPDGWRTVVTVETFFGEVTNGGIKQFLGNDHAAFAPYVVDSLKEVGLPEAAEVMRRVFEPFPDELFQAKDADYLEALNKLEVTHGDGFLDPIEDEFWNWFHDGNRGTIRERLHKWIVANMDRIVLGQ